MGKRHTAIWIVLFAILANTANGSFVPSSDVTAGCATVCDAQSFIRTLHDSTANAPDLLTVCNLQRTLGTATDEEAPGPPLSQDLVHAVVELQRTAVPLLSGGEDFADYRSAALIEDLPAPSAPRLHAWTPPGRASGNRYLYLLAPHAPPRNV